MTVQQAIEALQALVDSNPEIASWRLRIPFTPTEPTIGARAGRAVLGLHPGFDWDHGHVFLGYGQQLTEPSEKLRQQAVELRHLRAAAFYFLPRILNEISEPEKQMAAVAKRLDVLKKTITAQRALGKLPAK